MPSNNNPAGKQGLAIAALVCGILSIVTSLVWFIAIILAVLAIVFGSVSLRTPGRSKAIAGIITGSLGVIISISILALIFLGLPAMQLSQRDTARKTDVSVLATSISNYRSFNSGKMPTPGDLSTTDLSYILSVTSEGKPTTDTAVYKAEVSCDGTSTASINYSVSVLLENGQTYCQ